MEFDIYWFYCPFQSTLPRRERRCSNIFSKFSSKFQSTLPRRERRYIKWIATRLQEFQSTLPRRERPDPHRLLHLRSQVSIHAPTKGATCHDLRSGVSFWFQSTLPRRERLQGCDQIHYPQTRFQSTLPRRERRKVITIMSYVNDVSIHAPTKGATTCYRFDIYGCQFQSTLPRRERLLSP